MARAPATLAGALAAAAPEGWDKAACAAEELPKALLLEELEDALDCADVATEVFEEWSCKERRALSRLSGDDGLEPLARSVVLQLLTTLANQAVQLRTTDSCCFLEALQLLNSICCRGLALHEVLEQAVACWLLCGKLKSLYFLDYHLGGVMPQRKELLIVAFATQTSMLNGGREVRLAEIRRWERHILASDAGSNMGLPTVKDWCGYFMTRIDIITQGAYTAYLAKAVHICDEWNHMLAAPALPAPGRGPLDLALGSTLLSLVGVGLLPTDALATWPEWDVVKFVMTSTTAFNTPLSPTAMAWKGQRLAAKDAGAPEQGAAPPLSGLAFSAALAFATMSEQDAMSCSAGRAVETLWNTYWWQANQQQGSYIAYDAAADDPSASANPPEIHML